jgi:hypothetical protein
VIYYPRLRNNGMEGTIKRTNYTDKQRTNLLLDKLGRYERYICQFIYTYYLQMHAYTVYCNDSDLLRGLNWARKRRTIKCNICEINYPFWYMLCMPCLAKVQHGNPRWFLVNSPLRWKRIIYHQIENGRYGPCQFSDCKCLTYRISCYNGHSNCWVDSSVEYQAILNHSSYTALISTPVELARFQLEPFLLRNTDDEFRLTLLGCHGTPTKERELILRTMLTDPSLNGRYTNGLLIKADIDLIVKGYITFQVNHIVADSIDIWKQTKLPISHHNRIYPRQRIVIRREPFAIEGHKSAYKYMIIVPHTKTLYRCIGILKTFDIQHCMCCWRLLRSAVKKRILWDNCEILKCKCGYSVEFLGVLDDHHG